MPTSWFLLLRFWVSSTLLLLTSFYLFFLSFGNYFFNFHHKALQRINWLVDSCCCCCCCCWKTWDLGVQHRRTSKHTKSWIVLGTERELILFLLQLRVDGVLMRFRDTHVLHFFNEYNPHYSSRNLLERSHISRFVCSKFTISLLYMCMCLCAWSCALYVYI